MHHLHCHKPIEQMLKKFILTLSFSLFIFSVYSQNTIADSTLIAEQDSTLEKQGQEGFNLQTKEDSTLIADSLQQALLIQQITELKAKDARKKEELEMRLDSIKKAQKLRADKIKQQVDSLRSSTKGVVVMLETDTLFKIFSKLGPFSPSDRVNSINRKIDNILSKGDFDEKKLIVFEGEESYDLIYEDLFILSITERDAFWLNKSPKEVADSYRETLKTGIESYLIRHGLRENIKRIGLLLVVILILFFGIRYLNKGFTLINRFLVLKGKQYIRGIRIKNYEVLSVEKGEYVLKWVLKLVKWISITLLVYISLPIIFSIFPATKGIATTLTGYILNPVIQFAKAFLNFLPNLFSIAVIIILSRLFVRLLKYFSSEIESGKLVLNGFYPEWAKPTLNLLSILIYAFTFIIIFPYLPGSDSAIFQGVSVFFGLLISLGSSSAIGNIIAGLVITYMRPFKIGDRVKVGDITGDVIEKTMLVTRIRTIKNEDISIPNSAILNGSTVNFSSSSENLGLILNTSVTIGYDVPWRDVHEMLITAAKKTPLVMENPMPFVLQTSLDDFYVSYQINAYTANANKSAKIYSDLYGNIQDVFNEAAIEILSPHYEAERDGNPIAIPKDYLRKNKKNAPEQSGNTTEEDSKKD